jgi:hypothetical protein
LREQAGACGVKCAVQSRTVVVSNRVLKVQLHFLHVLRLGFYL